MSVVINTNTAATIASNNLSASNAMLQKSLNRLSSGSKINTSSDDAGGVAVASKLSAASKRAGVVSSNIANGVSFLQQQDNALKTVQKILNRMSELDTLALDKTKDSTDVGLYGKEFAELATQVTNILTTTFNGRSLLSSASATTGCSFDVTTNEAGGTYTTAAITATTETLDTRVVAALGASACGGTGNALKITNAVEEVAALRAQNGASQSVLGYYAELNQSSKANFESAVSKIMDVDVAEESTQLARWNTLVQAGTAMIAQANGSTQSALTLLR